MRKINESVLWCDPCCVTELCLYGNKSPSGEGIDRQRYKKCVTFVRTFKSPGKTLSCLCMSFGWKVNIEEDWLAASSQNRKQWDLLQGRPEILDSDSLYVVCERKTTCPHTAFIEALLSWKRDCAIPSQGFFFYPKWCFDFFIDRFGGVRSGDVAIFCPLAADTYKPDVILLQIWNV